METEEFASDDEDEEVVAVVKPKPVAKGAASSGSIRVSSRGEGTSKKQVETSVIINDPPVRLCCLLLP
jgi:hypothetical protein